MAGTAWRSSHSWNLRSTSRPSRRSARHLARATASWAWRAHGAPSRPARAIRLTRRAQARWIRSRERLATIIRSWVTRVETIAPSSTGVCLTRFGMSRRSSRASSSAHYSRRARTTPGTTAISPMATCFSALARRRVAAAATSQVQAVPAQAISVGKIAPMARTATRTARLSPIKTVRSPRSPPTSSTSRSIVVATTILRSVRLLLLQDRSSCRMVLS